jgi:hypothetical protein
MAGAGVDRDHSVRRGGTALPGGCRSAIAAPICAHGRGSHGETNFGTEWAGSDTTFVRFVRKVTPPGRKTCFRLLARLYQVGSRIHWVPPKGFELFPTSLPLSQASPGASARRSETSLPLPFARSEKRIRGAIASSDSLPIDLWVTLETRTRRSGRG